MSALNGPVAVMTSQSTGRAIVNDELLRLAERCEAANEADTRLLLIEACEASLLAQGCDPDTNDAMEIVDRFEELIDAEAYLDAAMTLVPEGWEVETLGQQSDGKWWAGLLRPLVADEAKGKVVRPSANARAFDCAAPALALCAASLRSRAHPLEGE